MGIALFYEGAKRIQRRDDNASRLVVLRPESGLLRYCFAAAWQQKPNGIKTLEEFRLYLESVVKKLDNPVRVSF